MPALFRIADSERRNAVDIRLTGAPLSANSRRRLTSSRDHALGLVCLRLNVGRENLSARIVILTSTRNERHAARESAQRAWNPNVTSAALGDALGIGGGVMRTPTDWLASRAIFYRAESRSIVNPRLSMNVRACSRESMPEASTVHSCTSVRL